MPALHSPADRMQLLPDASLQAQTDGRGALQTITHTEELHCSHVSSELDALSCGPFSHKTLVAYL